MVTDRGIPAARRRLGQDEGDGRGREAAPRRAPRPGSDTGGVNRRPRGPPVRLQRCARSRSGLHANFWNEWQLSGRGRGTARPKVHVTSLTSRRRESTPMAECGAAKLPAATGPPVHTAVSDPGRGARPAEPFAAVDPSPYLPKDVARQYSRSVYIDLVAARWFLLAIPASYGPARSGCSDLALSRASSPFRAHRDCRWRSSSRRSTSAGSSSRCSGRLADRLACGRACSADWSSARPDSQRAPCRPGFGTSSFASSAGIGWSVVNPASARPSWTSSPHTARHGDGHQADGAHPGGIASALVLPPSPRRWLAGGDRGVRLVVARRRADLATARPAGRRPPAARPATVERPGTA